MSRRGLLQHSALYLPPGTNSDSPCSCLGQGLQPLGLLAWGRECAGACLGKPASTRLGGQFLLSSATSAEQQCPAQGPPWVLPTVTAARKKATAAALLLESGFKFPLCRQRTLMHSRKMGGCGGGGVKVPKKCNSISFYEAYTLVRNSHTNKMG